MCKKTKEGDAMQDRKERIQALLKRYELPIWSVLSFVGFLVVWQLISQTKGGGVIFAPPSAIARRLVEYAEKGTLWQHAGISLFRVLAGFGLGFFTAIPIAFLLGWYRPFRLFFEPWLNFIKSIPPLAYIPLVVVAAGIGEKAKVTVIFIACFLSSVITIYQGVMNVDETLIKAARVLGARDAVMFFQVIVPASLPFIITAMKLGLSAALTTLLASEMTGAVNGLGTMIQTASQYLQMDVVLMGIVVIGVIGVLLQTVARLIENRLTGWQEKRDGR